MAKAHILLLDPHVESAHTVQTFLQRAGNCKVTIAHSAQAAIHAADETKPDLVILELAIREHNGFAFLQEFRSYQDWASIPVIIHSHLDVSEAAASEGWKTLGAVAYFYKPTTTLQQLGAAVQKVIAE